MAYASTEVDTDEENTDELYLINADPLTTHVTFLMPGQATATAIRHFLEISLTAWQVIHEDDQVLTTAGVTDNDLPKLQVKIWTTTHELPVNFDAIVPAASFGMTYSISQLKLQIINRLSSKSSNAVYVLRAYHDSEPRICSSTQ